MSFNFCFVSNCSFTFPLPLLLASTHIKKKKKFPRLVDLLLVSKSLSKDLELERERCIEKKAETFPVSCHSKRNLEMC